MKKIGVLYCGYNTEEYVEQSLQTWTNAKLDRLMGCEFVICAVSLPFLEYKGDSFKDKTQDILWEFYNGNLIDRLITEPEYIPEWVARDIAAQYLIGQGVDAIWLVDSDEIYDEQSIANILQYVELERFCSWFRIPLTNYVFDKQTVLEEKFCPPRIWRVNTNGYKLNECIFDNDFSYKGTVNTGYGFQEVLVKDKDLPSKTIPSRLVDIKHFSWLSNSLSKRKIAYQVARGWQCSYKWDDINGLSFNEEYYKKIGQPIPRTMKISS